MLHAVSGSDFSSAPLGAKHVMRVPSQRDPWWSPCYTLTNERAVSRVTNIFFYLKMHKHTANFVSYPLLSTELLEASTNITDISLPSFPSCSGEHFLKTLARAMLSVVPGYVRIEILSQVFKNISFFQMLFCK